MWVALRGLPLADRRLKGVVFVNNFVQLVFLGLVAFWRPDFVACAGPGDERVRGAREVCTESPVVVVTCFWGCFGGSKYPRGRALLIAHLSLAECTSVIPLVCTS